MSVGTTEAPTRSNTDTAPPRIYAALVGLTALAVLLQGLWAGIFLEHDGERDAANSWIDVHARGGEIALVLAVLAAALAIWKLRARKDLIIGSVILVVLLVLESYLGGLIRESGKDTLTAVHVPLGMAIMAVAIWLPVRARIR
ncbi:MAG: hypothetical protein M3Y42_01760 [Actinomycetota bacterium]|nr:hypothetical protein [Actinomycetota bacterium]MDQ2955672.1 hypothetical protein [Actinomycetota bacterium]